MIVPERTRINILFSWFRLHGFLLRGTNYYCICCNAWYQKFLSYGNIPRKNAMCPYCHSLERTRLLMYYLIKKTTIFNGECKILHFAPEKAIERNLKNLKNEYITADINPAYADHVIDITNIPYPDNYFDYILCSHVLGHVYNEKKAIDEIYRVTKPEGNAIILTPLDSDMDKTFEDENITDPSKRLILYGEPDLLRLHGNDFLERLKRENMIIDKLDYRLEFSIEEREKFCLGDGKREILFVCRKKD